MLLGRQKKRPNPQLFAMNPVWLFKVPRQFHTSNISRDMMRTDLRLGDLNSDNKLSVGQIQEALRLGLLVPMYRPTSELLCFQV